MNIPVRGNGIPVLSKQDIDNLAEQFLFEYDKTLTTIAKPIPIEDIIENYLGLEIDFKCLDKNKTILGLTAFNEGPLEVYNPALDQKEVINVSEGTIIIENQLVEDENLAGRYRFTCSHETSHWLLHRKKFEKDKNQMKMFEEKQVVGIKCLSRNIENIFGRNNISTDDDWLEWQADSMGGAILMPKKAFTLEFIETLRRLDIRQNYIYVDSQKCNIQICNKVIAHLARKFNVSKKAVKVRLSKFNLLIQPSSQQIFGFG